MQLGILKNGDLIIAYSYFYMEIMIILENHQQNPNIPKIGLESRTLYFSRLISIQSRRGSSPFDAIRWWIDQQEERWTQTKTKDLVLVLVTLHDGEASRGAGNDAPIKWETKEKRERERERECAPSDQRRPACKLRSRDFNSELEMHYKKFVTRERERIGERETPIM